MLSQSVLDDLAPRIKPVVVWLNEEGFETTDSGDGKSDMECAMDEPMVVVAVDDRSELVDTADRLAFRLGEFGIECGIQAMYSPVDGVSSVLLFGKGLLS